MIARLRKWLHGNPARELAMRLGLVEIARFESGDQETVVWADPRGVALERPAD